MTQADLARLNTAVVEAIPLAHAAGIRLEADGDDRLAAHAPFAANSNPHGTAFGGSLYVTALVAGYAQTVWLVERAGLDLAVVIRRADADYRRPVTGDFSARVAPIAKQTHQRFLQALRQHGRGRIDLTLCVMDARLAAFTLHARFAAIAPGSDAPTAAEPA